MTFFPSTIAGLALALAAAGPACAQTALKFNNGWKFEASAAGFLLAEQRGYYRAEGLDVTIDTGNGSAAAVTSVATNTYDIAVADTATLIEFNAGHPAQRPMAVAIMYDINPNAIVVRRDGPIRQAADLAGKTIAAQPFQAPRKLFPILAKRLGMDPASVTWQNLAPDIAVTRFARGELDGVSSFNTTAINLADQGMPLDKQRMLRFSDLGLKSYGNAFVASARAMQEKPEAVAGFVRASIKGWLDAIADPKAGAAAVKKREPLADEGSELRRLQIIIAEMRTPDIMKNGWGGATRERLQTTLDETVEGFGLRPGLTIDQYWTDRFLPPAATRIPK